MNKIKTSYTNTLQTINELIEKDMKFKKDVTLNLNEFNVNEYVYDREALARMIQNIVITKPGTYPNNPDFGVGIENYMFELGIPKTMADISSNVSSQLNKWIDRSNDPDLEIQVDGRFVKSNTNSQYVNLVLFFTITRDPSSNVINSKAEKNNSDSFILYLTNDLANRKLVSKLEL